MIMYPWCRQDRHATIVVVERAQTYVDGMFNVDESFFDRGAKHCSVVFMIVVPRVGMGVEMHERERSVVRIVRSQQRKADVVIAAQRQHLFPSTNDRRGVRFKGRAHSIPVAFMEHNVTPVDYREGVKRVDVPRPHPTETEVRARLTNRTRTEARARAKRCGAIPRNPADHNVGFSEFAGVAPTRKARSTGEDKFGIAPSQRTSKRVVTRCCHHGHDATGSSFDP